jgi:hypothetical protein
MAISAGSGAKPASSCERTFGICLLAPRRGRPPISKPQKTVDLALSPDMILGRERIDASIDADVAYQELRALDKVRDLSSGSPAETTCGSCHRRVPSLSSQRYLAIISPIRKRPNLILAVVPIDFCTTTTNRDAVFGG